MRVSIRIHSNHVHILHRFLRYSEIVVDNSRFEPTRPLPGAPLLGVSLLDLAEILDVRTQKTRIRAIPWAIVGRCLRDAVLVQYRSVSDGRTDT